ncbi:P-II family nitrogen regulator [Wenzhouxiangella sp. AB-CW3]|uniref:P-II family nitrogen regulator n=1 Tax=Wenzhouxiangella sp. AB-CW3 TaxID=2771012 RepID=UPI00168A8CB8|nr:P-II family nitrogen regulator [Wenzhouxiangella sp. AB-CW3]QOC21745.1 P-II family nitrogen regulator [Wenzhouxiangella sp. AB-CW3]
MNFKLIMAMIDDQKVEAVMEAARAAGASGATIIPQARGQGLHRHLTFFGLEYLGARNILLYLVEASRSAAVMDAITEAGELDESKHTGVALELDVSRATGLGDHIKALQEQG